MEHDNSLFSKNKLVSETSLNVLRMLHVEKSIHDSAIVISASSEAKRQVPQTCRNPFSSCHNESNAHEHMDSGFKVTCQINHQFSNFISFSTHLLYPPQNGHQ